MSSDDVSALGQTAAETRSVVEEASARVFRVWQRLHLMDAGFLPTERRVLGESLKLLDDLRASLAERERATEAALAEAREARWGAEYAADSAAEEAEKAIAALTCALVEAERQRDEARDHSDLWAKVQTQNARLAKLERKYVTAKKALLKERDEAQGRADVAERLFDLASDVAAAYKADAEAAEAALADTREALAGLDGPIAWIAERYPAVVRTMPGELRRRITDARAVLAAVPPQQGAPADTDARPANTAGTRGGESL
jgi:hypothetical protein